MAAPVFRVFAGPNGSGESSLVLRLRFAGISLPNHIDPDALAATYAGPQAGRDLRAQREAARIRAAAMAERSDFSVETILSSPKWFDIVAEVRSLGYRVEAHYVATLDPTLNVARVSQRVARGGHHVAEPLIRLRYEASLRNAARLIAEADRSILYDNSALGAGPRLFAELKQGRLVRLLAPPPTWAESLLPTSI